MSKEKTSIEIIITVNCENLTNHPRNQIRVQSKLPIHENQKEMIPSLDVKIIIITR